MDAVVKFAYSVVLVMTFLFIVVAFTPAYSADMTVYDGDEIYIYGEILEGDGEKFLSLLDGNKNIKYVSLNSNGGLVSEGMFISYAVAEYQLTTVVPDTYSCASMCSIIFMSGATKIMAKDQYLEFHPAYLEWPDGRKEIDLQTSAQMSWWLGRMGIPLEIVWEMTEATPDTTVSFTAIDLNNLGVDIYLLK